VDVATLSRELFYQLVLCEFEAGGPRMVLEPPPDVHVLMRMALQLEKARGMWEVRSGVKWLW
jgi:hypothetical protein